VEKPQATQFGIPALCVSSWNELLGTRIRPGRRDHDADDEGTAAGDPDTARLGDQYSAEAGAIRECEEHGWMQDRADPHAHARAFAIGRREPPPGVSPEAAAVAIAEVLKSIGDTCPECPTEGSA
jgi:hypothetical protein